MFARLNEWLALTSTERKVLWFLSITLGIGVGIRLVQSAVPGAPAFDYRRSDSTFAALSAAAAVSDSSAAAEEDGPLDLNAASKSELMGLPGVGVVTAERILQYRNEHGRFTSVDELTKIKGISRKKLERLRPSITVVTPSHRKSSP